MKKFSIIFFVFLISRLIFFNGEAVFFDSQEYLFRFSQQNILGALLNGHWPYHFGYVLLYWPVYRFFGQFIANPVQFVIFLQTLISFLGVFWFYKFLSLLTDKKTAFRSALIASFLPLYWITNVTVMVESSYISFFLGSLYYFANFLKEKNNKDFFISAFLFGFAFFINQTVILWIPLWIILLFNFRKAFYIKAGGVYLIAITFFLLLEGILVSTPLKTSIISSLVKVYLSKNHEFSAFPTNIDGLFVYLRNFLIPLMRNNASLMVILSGFSLSLLSSLKNKLLFWIGLFWIIPAFAVNQWSDSLFYGREALIASFGLSFAAGYIIKKEAFYFLLGYILLVSFPALLLLKQPIPYLQEAEMVSDLPKKSFLFESHFARPQVSKTYKGNAIYVNEPVSQFPPEKTIKAAISENTPVFVSGQALSEPYGLYTGPYLHVLGLSYRRDFDLESLMSKFTLKRVKSIDSASNIVLYRITSDSPSPYPIIPNLSKSYRRIDYFDPLTRLWFVIAK